MSARNYQRKLDIRNGCVDLSHGSGGRAMAQLISGLFHQSFGNPWLARGNDQSVFDVNAGRMVMTTDGYVVSPLFFPGGNIGSLAVHGTVNDIAMAGARPLYLSASFIIEEGFRFAELKQIADSMGEAARAAGIHIITGDTKVVERGKADGLFISTAGVGVLPDGLDLSAENARVGDRVLVSGSLGDHGVAMRGQGSSPYWPAPGRGFRSVKARSADETVHGKSLRRKHCTLNAPQARAVLLRGSSIRAPVSPKISPRERTVAGVPGRAFWGINSTAPRVMKKSSRPPSPAE